MNVRQYIKKAKEGFRKVKAQRAGQQRMNTQRAIENLKARRVEAESRASLNRIRQKEEMRINKANLINDKYSTSGKVKAALKTIKARNDAIKAASSGKEANKFALGGGPQWGKMGGGPNWGSMEGKPRQQGMMNTSHLWGGTQQNRMLKPKKKKAQYVAVRVR